MTDMLAGKIIIAVAPNGARRMKSDHPALPLNPEELADCAASISDAGAALMHLHIRDHQGGHSLDTGRYREALAAIREKIGDKLVLQITTEAQGMYDRAQQMAVVRELRPEAVSLALRELCPDERSEREAGAFFREIRQAGVMPQYILYTPEEVQRFDRLRQNGFFGEQQPFALFVIGRYTTDAPTPLSAYLERFNNEAFPWAVCAFGKAEAAIMLEAAQRGGHCRIGFENNLFMADGSIAADNTALLYQLKQSLTELPRQWATAQDIRRAFANP